MSGAISIAYVSDSVIPSRLANSVHVMRMSRAFAAVGASVTLYARRGDGSDPFAAYGVARNFALCFVSRAPWLQSPWTAVEAVLHARRSGADLVYTRSIYAVTFASWLGLSSVIELHAEFGAYARAKAALLRRALRRGSLCGIVVISPPLRDYYAARLGVAPDSIHVAPDGADPVPADTPPLLERTGSRVAVGYAGQLFAGRGIELIADLAERLPGIDFHVAGGFDADVAAWRARAANLPNLTFHGHLPAADTAGFLQSVELALAPYQRRVTILGAGDSSHWMSPLKLFEYMASGAAIVASDLPAIRTVLRDGETAL
ncbi:MAG: glycosyltransferase family 4 protein, partial [Proteobacteria bacterium]|nr:glycosyltransferase family 4 protein [Pseudomonadota bacterium]